MYQTRTDDLRLDGIQAWVMRPVQEGRYPAIVMLPGRNGTSQAMLDVAVQFAEEGIVAMPVNYLSEGEVENSAVVPMIGKALDYLKAQPDVAPDRIALSGYCRGGGLTYNGLACYDGFTAGVIWHGAVNDDSPKLNVPVIILHGVSDSAVSIDRVFDLVKDLDKQGKTFQLKTYAATEHAFTLPGGASYNPVAAEDAFREAVLFLRRRYGMPAGTVDPLVREPVPA
jgi:carboxymethylenebutenolidase